MPRLKTQGQPLRAAILTVALALCGGAALADSLADSYIDLKKGGGSARVMPDGKTVFTFVVPENAYDDIIPRKDTAGLRAQHEYILSAWVGSAKICPKGYTVKRPTVSTGFVIYEGTCR